MVRSAPIARRTIGVFDSGVRSDARRSPCSFPLQPIYPNCTGPCCSSTVTGRFCGAVGRDDRHDRPRAAFYGARQRRHTATVFHRRRRVRQYRVEFS